MPPSPKVHKAKSPEPNVPLYGCEHIQRLLTKSPEVTTNTIQHYKMLLRVIFDKTPVIPQTTKSIDKRPVTTLKPNFLCLQCPTTCTAQDRHRHGELKAHMFYVDSQSGGLLCQMCDDFIWDPTLEELRLRKIGTGSFTSRKRKRDELFTEASKDDTNIMSINTTAAPCRATGLRGIFNMGSTCFMSVILQSFLHNPLLRNFYLSDGHPTNDCEVDNCLSCRMDELFQEFYSKDNTSSFAASKILSDSWLCQQAAFSDLAGYDEHDAHEYFQFLCEELHRTTRKERKDSSTSIKDTNGNSNGHHITGDCDCIIHQTFYGKFQSTLTCQSCGSVSTSVEPFLDLSLAIERICQRRNSKGGNISEEKSNRLLTLQRCLDEEYMQPDSLTFGCSACSMQREAEKQLSIKNLPNVLCIQFKRFEHHRGLNQTSKIGVKVQFPLQINMLPYTNRARTHDVRENFELQRSCTYDLLSIVVHVGSMNTGHYISYSRVGNQWFRFDDHKITMASESQVLGSEAFLLFYIIRSLA